jgi:riboflavin kinase/FMN adenylyltransferase
VYAAWAKLQSEPTISDLEWLRSQDVRLEQHRAVVNIGTRPTFEDGPRTVEAHLLDFNRDIYGQRLALDFVARLRPEKRFNGIEGLVTQIQRDTEEARKLLHEP